MLGIGKSTYPPDTVVGPSVYNPLELGRLGRFLHSDRPPSIGVDRAPNILEKIFVKSLKCVYGPAKLCTSRVSSRMGGSGFQRAQVGSRDSTGSGIRLGNTWSHIKA